MNLLEFQNDPNAFRQALLIDTDAGVKPFAEVMDQWQDEDFKALDNGWQRAVIGTAQESTYQRAWLERPRGHSKTQDIGVMALWALFASRRRVSGIGAAGDLDQARLLRDAIGRLVYVNPWLSSFIEVQANRVINKRTQSCLDIIASDAPTAYGILADFIVADEIVHWKKRDLWDSLLSSAAKRSTCMFVVITNAGISDDWQWTTREVVRQDDAWFFSRLDGPVASWITDDRLREQEKLLPNIAYRRLWLNEWTSGGGDALTEDVINAAFRSDLQAVTTYDPNLEYVAGVDAGISRDASALCILGIRRRYSGHGTIRLVFTKLWKPTKGMRVDLGKVEDALVKAHQFYKLKQINYDPWELRYLASRLQAGGMGRIARQDAKIPLPLVEIPPTGMNLQRMASALLEAFNDRRVELYPEPDLKRDLQRMRVEERSYGFRIESPRDSTGHGDLGSAFQLALLAASELAAKRKAVAGMVDTQQRGPKRLERLERYEQKLQDITNEEDRRAYLKTLLRGHFGPTDRLK